MSSFYPNNPYTYRYTAKGNSSGGTNHLSGQSRGGVAGMGLGRGGGGVSVGGRGIGKGGMSSTISSSHGSSSIGSASGSSTGAKNKASNASQSKSKPRGVSSSGSSTKPNQNGMSGSSPSRSPRQHQQQASGSGSISPRRVSSGSIGSSASLQGFDPVVQESKEHEVETALSGRDVLVKLAKLLNKPNKKFVWWKNSVGKCCGGHQVVWSAKKALLRDVDGNYEIRLRRDVLDEPPQDVTKADATTIVNQLEKLLSDFETIADIEETRSGYFGSSWGTSRVVHQVKLTYRVCSFVTGFEKMSVRRPSGGTVWIPVRDLRSVAIGGNSGAAESSLRVELAQVQRQLDEAGAIQTSLQRDLEEARSGRNQAESELEDSRRKVDRLTREKSTLSTTKRSVETELSSSKKKISQLEMRARTTERQHREELARRREEIGKLERTKTSNEQTIRLWSKRFGDLKQEKNELQNSLNEQLVEVRRYQANEEAYQRQEKFLVEEVKRNESLMGDNAVLREKLGQYKLGALDSPFQEINFKCELANLRSQQHDSALEACELLRLNEEQSFELLWRVFMFCYGYFENRMVEIRKMLNMNTNPALDGLFVARMQENYVATGDLSGLEDAFVQHFEEELRFLVSDPRMVGYVRECGKLCWCVVLKSSPKLEFRPRVDDIVASRGEVVVAFDSAKFSDYTGNMGRSGGVVDQYVLPGLYRVDSNAAVILPCVRAHKPDAPGSRPSSVGKPPAEESGSESDPLADIRENLRPVEELITECRSYKVRTTLKQMGINLQKVDIVIGCADDDCDYVFSSTFKEYTRLARGIDRLVCGNNDDHDGAKILSISGM